MSILPVVRPAVAAAVLIAVLALALPAASPSAAPTPQSAPLELKPVPHSQVGRVDGTRAFIAVSFDGRRVRAYVCDGTRKRRATISQWFTARWDGLTPIAMVRNGIELRLDAVRSDGRITGQRSAFSGPHTFAVEPTTGPAGLFDGTDLHGRDSARATGIVQADGSVRGVMVCPRPPRVRCRMVTVTLTNGTTREEVRCFDVSGC